MSTPTHVPGFYMTQKLTLMINRYEIRAIAADGQPGELLAFAEQKRMAFKEHVTFYSDAAKTQAVFSFKARQKLDLGAEYDVFDERGEAIGYFRKDFKASLLRSTFHLNGPYVNAVGQERSKAIAIIRRFVDFPFTFHFDFLDGENLVMSVDRQFSLRDRYTVHVPYQGLDFRLAAAMAVGLDALMGR
jgi:uncharacterized protein YxjI